MGFYSEVIVPRLLDLSMSNPSMAQYRQEVLADVQGEVLEIGFGTGLNLPHYPERIERLVTVDPNPGMNALARQRIEQSAIAVDQRILSGETLPMADNTFDSVVSTWTLCSIPKVGQALQEIHRVLKPGGRFYFIEHGLSQDPQTQVWQHRLTPITQAIADGCHLDRPIHRLISTYFSHVAIETFEMSDGPGFLMRLYPMSKGVATKAQTT